MIVCVIHGPAGCGKTTLLKYLENAFRNRDDGKSYVQVRMVPGGEGPGRYTRAGILRLATAGVTDYLIDDCTYRDIEEAQAVAFAEGPQFCRDLTLYMVRNS